MKVREANLWLGVVGWVSRGKVVWLVVSSGRYGGWGLME